MKLIKFIAAAALVASTSLLSGGNTAAVGAMQEIAGVCPDWPHCRVDNIADQTTDLQQQMKTAVVLKAA
jgi:hypothetical protein